MVDRTLRRKTPLLDILSRALNKDPVHVKQAESSNRSVLASFFLALCLGFSAMGCESEPPPERPVVQSVKILTIGEARPGTVREYPGTISAAQRADLAFEVPGRMIDFPVKEGDEVAKGAVLGRLDARDYEARLGSARAMLRKAEADHQRSTNLYKQDPGAIALTKLDADKRGVEVAAAQYKEAEKAYEDTILRAPFDGVVARKLVKDFANVRAKDPILILQDTSHLEIVVNVPERDFASVRRRSESMSTLSERLQPRVVVSSLPDRHFPAQFKEVATVADPVTRTFAVTLRFDNPEDVRVLPGMTAKVVARAAAGDGDAVLIPANAVIAGADRKSFVWLVTKSMAVERRNVELGPLRGDQVEVHNGLATGDAVAISGIARLTDGMQVRRFER
jgi:RND family efflux transporter MFP subunit